MAEGKFKIREVLSVFSHFGEYYVLFCSYFSEFPMLYCYNPASGMKSLFYGERFCETIPEIRARKSKTCIECSLSLQIKGGISYDGGDLLEFGLSKEEANNILQNLKREANTPMVSLFEE